MNNNNNNNNNNKEEEWVSLGLEGDNDDDDDDKDGSSDEYGRFVVEYKEKEWLCYGGESGIVTCVNWETKEHWEVIRMDDPITALVYYENESGEPQLAVGCDDGSVHIYQEQVDELLLKPNKSDDADDLFSQTMNNTSEPIVMSRRDMAIRDLCLWQSNQWMMVATESGLAYIDLTSDDKQWQVQEKVDQVQQQGGIRAVACYSNDLLLVCGMDGKCSMWNVDWNCVHRWENSLMDVDVGLGANSVQDVMAKPSIHQNYILLPSQKLYDGEHWQTLPFSFTCGTMVSHHHLVVATASGDVQLYDLPSVTLVSTLTTIAKPITITQLLYSGSTLNMVCHNGTVRRLPMKTHTHKTTNPLPNKVEPNKEVEFSTQEENDDSNEKEDSNKEKETSSSHKRLRKGKEDDVVDKDEDDDLFDNDAVVPETKKVIDDEEEGENEKENNVTEEEPKTSKFVDGAAQEDNDDNDDNADNFEDFGVIRNDDDDDDDMEDDVLVEEKVMAPPEYLPPREYMPTVEMQLAFAPASTPDILCWNHEGTVTSLPNDMDGTNKVYITFTDAAFRKPVSFIDTEGFLGGSLGHDGAIFYSDVEYPDKDDEEMDVLQQVHQLSDATKAVVRESTRKKQTRGSSIYFTRFDTFGSHRDKDWLWVLPANEKAMGCACGQGWAAIITNQKFLRLYSSSGVQKPILWTKGQQYVTCAGRGRLLATVYHTSNPTMDGSQCLGFTLYDAVEAKELYSGDLSAVSSGSTLSWVGFSNDLSLCVLDSKGLLSMFHLGSGWIPFLDTASHKKSSTDIFWPVTVLDGKFMSVYLRGGIQYPDSARRPITTSLKAILPMALDSSGKSDKVDEASLRATMALHQRKFVDKLKLKDGKDSIDDVMEEYDNLCANVDKVTLKLFIATCEKGRVEKALDITKRLFLEKSYDLAVTIADRLQLYKLSDRILEYKEVKFSQDDEEEDDDEFSNGGDPDDGYQYTRERRGREDSNQVSPDTAAHKRRLMENDNTNNKSTKRKLDTPPERSTPSINPSSNKRFNPFAKKKMQSPGKLMSPIKEESNAKLSRQSTFTNHSRQQRLSEKQIL